MHHLGAALAADEEAGVTTVGGLNQVAAGGEIGDQECGLPGYIDGGRTQHGVVGEVGKGDGSGGNAAEGGGHLAGEQRGLVVGCRIVRAEQSGASSGRVHNLGDHGRSRPVESKTIGVINRNIVRAYGQSGRSQNGMAGAVQRDAPQRHATVVESGSTGGRTRTSCSDSRRKSDRLVEAAGIRSRRRLADRRGRAFHGDGKAPTAGKAALAARVVIHHIQTPETIWVRAAKSRAEGRRAHRSGASPRTWSGRRKGRSYTISVGSWLEGITTEVRLRQQPRAPVIKRKGNVALSRLTACVRERHDG